MVVLIIFMAQVFMATSLEPWIHQIQAYGPEVQRGQAMVENLVTLHNYATKSIILDDGREVTCQIPLDPSFRISEDLEPKAKIKEPKLTEHINQQQAAQGLFPLTNQCTYHFTKEFIWEFCFKKYLRQFDDNETVKNMNKNEFFVGYANSFDKLKNSTVGMYSAEWHQIPLESDPVLVVDGQVAKVRNYCGPLKPNLIEVVVSDYERIFQKSPTEFLKLAKFRGDFRGYIIKLNILCVISNELFLLKEVAPFRIITSNFQLLIDNTKPAVRMLERSKIYQYKNYLFGTNLLAQSFFVVDQTFAIRQSSSQGLILARITYLIDGNMVEISNTFTSEIQAVQILLLEQSCQNFTYVYYPMKITILQNIVFASNRYYSLIGEKALEKNDSILIFNQTITASIIEVDEFSIKHIYNDGIFVLKNYLTKNLLYHGEFIVRKAERRHQVPTYRDQNQALIIESANFEDKFEEYSLFLSSLTLNREKYQSHYQGRQFRKHNPNAIGFSFRLQSLKERGFLLILRLLLQNQRGAEIVFLSSPQNILLVRNIGTRGTFKNMDPRFQNQSLSKWNYWVILQDNYLFVGRGNSISQQNLMVRFRLQESIPDTIGLEIDDQSFGLRIFDLRELKLQQLIINSAASQISANPFTILNFTLGDELKKKTYTEHYIGGTYCAAANSSRQVEIKLECLQDSLLQIIKINEPSTCHYKVIVGTWLLCPQEQQQIEPKPHNGQQMICQFK